MLQQRGVALFYFRVGRKRTGDVKLSKKEREETFRVERLWLRSEQFCCVLFGKSVEFGAERKRFHACAHRLSTMGSHKPWLDLLNRVKYDAIRADTHKYIEKNLDLGYYLMGTVLALCGQK